MLFQSISTAIGLILHDDWNVIRSIWFPKALSQLCEQIRHWQIDDIAQTTSWPPLTPRLLLCCYCFKKSRNNSKKVCSQRDEKILIWHSSSFPEKSISVLKSTVYCSLLCFTTIFPVRCRALLLGPLQLEPTDFGKN